MSNNSSTLTLADCDAVTIDSEDLHYHAPIRTFTAEASDLPEFGDVINVRSRKTGKVVAFRLSKTAEDREGEVTGWMYSSDEGDMSLSIFND